MPNRLASESSPYLLQHAENPVDWWPWCDEAFERAKAEDKPIFLSVGYSACHWCHVMEHESFENDSIAGLLNDNFISIKVDREERPDVDHIYMQAVMALSGHGGWPLSAFLTPHQQFFFGGTYWPPENRSGLPGFAHVLQSVAASYKNQRDTIEQQSAKVSELLEKNSAARRAESTSDDELLSRNTISNAIDALQKSFDVTDGGFGSAPKFPHPMDLNLLIRSLDFADTLANQSRASVGQMIEVTLNKMAYGGIYDHLAGGFARYSVDTKWLVPHFEKMLYDNAQLANVYLNAYQATDNKFFRRVTEKTLDYIQNYLTDEAGGFYSTEDADSEGVEGKFYVWSKAEVLDVLGNEIGERFCGLYNISESGNFEGSNILHVNISYGEFAEKHGLEKDSLRAEMAEARTKLLNVRDRRVRPGLDDKVLVSWNALAIDAFANASTLDPQNTYLLTAQNAANFLLNALRRDDGRLLHTWRNGQAKLDAYLDDYAYLINALVSLYEADFDPRWIDRACDLLRIMIGRFADDDGGFFFTADDHESLIVRTRDLQDSSVPSGSSMAAYSLIRLGRLVGNTEWIELGKQTILTAAGLIERAPAATGQMLLALDLLLRPNSQHVLIDDPQNPLRRDLLELFLASRDKSVCSIFATQTEAGHSVNLNRVLTGKTAIGGQPTLYICENFTCLAPIVGPEAIEQHFKPANLGEIV